MKDWIYSLFLATAAVLAPVKGILIAIGLLILFDTIAGIWAAKKKGEVISSKKFSNVLSKIIFYNIAIGTGMAIEYLIGDLIPVIKLIAAAIAVTEGLSILESVQSITGLNLLAVKDILKRKKD